MVQTPQKMAHTTMGNRSRAPKVCRGTPPRRRLGAPTDSEQNNVDYLRALRLIAKCIARDSGKSLAMQKDALMKLSFVRSSVALLSLSVVGCNTATPEGGSATPAATGAVVPQDNMPEYCRAAASSKYGVKPGYVATLNVVRRAGGFAVEGTAYTGPRGLHVYLCRFDSRGAFVGIFPPASGAF